MIRTKSSIVRTFTIHFCHDPQLGVFVAVNRKCLTEPFSRTRMYDLDDRQADRLGNILQGWYRNNKTIVEREVTLIGRDAAISFDLTHSEYKRRIEFLQIMSEVTDFFNEENLP